MLFQKASIYIGAFFMPDNKMLSGDKI